MTETSDLGEPSDTVPAPDRRLGERIRGHTLGKLWFWLPIVPLAVFDLWSKAAVFAFMTERYPGPEYARRHAVWSEDAFVNFHFVTWRNTGTVWGFGQSYTDVLIWLRALALLLIVYFAIRLPRQSKGHLLVLAMIMAGAIGNLYDNLFERASGVRDFLLFSTELGGERYQWPAFNVADSCICVGAIVLAILLWRGPVEDEADPA